MPRKKRKKKGEEQAGIDITSFIEVEPPKEAAPAKVEKVLPAETPLTSSPVYQYIMARKRVSKSELYRWCKAKGIPAAELYRVIKELTDAGLLKKKFDENVEDLVYEVKTS